MNFLKLASLLSLTIFWSGCVEYYHVKPVADPNGITNPTDPVVPITPVGTAALASAFITRKASASIDLTCSTGATHYMQASSAPLASDGGWTACPSTNFTISQSLVDGENNLKYWFKSSTDTVSSSATAVTVQKGELRVDSPYSLSGIYFGTSLTKISDTRFVVAEPYNNELVYTGGAVRIYDQDGNLINSVLGDQNCDTLGGDPLYSCYGEGSIKVISSDRFVIISPYGALGNGKIILVNAVTGAVIRTFVGDDASDTLGMDGVTVLSNGNFLIQSSMDDVGGITDAGSVMLINSSTGDIVATISGDDTSDSVGSHGVTDLGNGKFSVSSAADNVGGISGAGSVKFYNSDGTLAASFVGNAASDNFGRKGVKKLSGGNFVIVSPEDNIGAVTDAGSVTLVSGVDYSVITTIVGDNNGDTLGDGGAFVLSNGNFAIFSTQDDQGLTNNGTVKIVNGASGIVINTLAGTANNQYYGSGTQVDLGGGRFAFSTPYETVGAITGAGSVRLVNAAGTVYGTISGNNANDNLGSSSITALATGNLVIASSNDDAGLLNNGTVKIIDGVSGLELNQITGLVANDKYGSSVTPLSNGNFSFQSPSADSGPIVNAGRVWLVDGSTGAAIDAVAGSTASEQLGSSGVEIHDGNLAILTLGGDIPGKPSVGSLMIMDGVTGDVLDIFGGDVADDGRMAGMKMIMIGKIAVVSYAGGESGGNGFMGYIKMFPLD